MLAITVNTAVDEVDNDINDGDVSIRDAISHASPGETINFDVASMDGATITLNLNEGEIEINESLTIDASMLSNGLTIDANDPTPTLWNGDGIRIFTLIDPSNGANGGAATPTIELKGLTLTGADPFNTGGDSQLGGAIQAKTRLFLRDIEIVDNKAADGGGLYVELAIDSATNDALVIENTTFSGNEAFLGGGARIYATNSLNTNSTIFMDNVTFDDNAAVSQGGGAHVEFLRDGTAIQPGPRLEIAESVFTNNESGGNGAGLYLRQEEFSSASIQTTTFTFNAATGVSSPRFGGAVYAKINDGAEFEIVESTVSDNSAAAGGGIAAEMTANFHDEVPDARFTVSRSRIENNSAEEQGGGMYFHMGSGVTTTISESIIRGNDAGLALPPRSTTYEEPANSGGGIYAYMYTGGHPTELLIVDSEISENTAGAHGGGLTVCTKRGYEGAEFAQLTVRNSTLSGNQAGHTTAANDPGTGGGVHLAIFDGQFDPEERLFANFENTTITDNTADEGGGIYSYVTVNGPPRYIDAVLTNTILSGNTKHSGVTQNFWGSINLSDTNYNLISDDSNPTTNDNYFVDHLTYVEKVFSDLGAGNLNNGGSNDPGLKPLANYGGFTRTHKLKVTSPAVDAGDPNAVQGVNVPDYDQRGAAHDRVFDILGIDNDASKMDMGAFELQCDELGGDFDLDGDVDGDDFLLWQGGFGMSSGAEHGDGDADCDGDVDGDDFLIWQSEFGSGVGAGTLFDENNAVQVVEVIISGSNSEHDPFYFSTVVGSGDQLSTVPVGGADTISIVFSEHANVDAGDLDIVGLYTANEPNLVSFEYDIDTMTATWKFDNWALGDQYVLTLDSDSIEDAEGSALDGEWSNPAHVTTTNAAVSEFPSGDGNAGGDFAFVMTLLAGDANLDNVVDGADYLIWQGNFSMNVGAQFGHADGDGDGDVDGDDFLIYQATSGTEYVAIWILTDIDGDGDVDNDDADIFATNWGAIDVGWSGGDFNEDGVVDMDDFWLWYAQSGVNLVIAS